MLKKILGKEEEDDDDKATIAVLATVDAPPSADAPPWCGLSVALGSVSTW